MNDRPALAEAIMTKTCTIIAFLLLTVSANATDARPFPKAPEFSSDAVWIDAGEKAPHSIAGYRGRVLLVDFWSTPASTASATSLP